MLGGSMLSARRDGPRSSLTNARRARASTTLLALEYAAIVLLLAPGPRCPSSLFLKEIATNDLVNHRPDGMSVVPSLFYDLLDAIPVSKLDLGASPVARNTPIAATPTIHLVNAMPHPLSNNHSSM